MWYTIYFYLTIKIKKVQTSAIYYNLNTHTIYFLFLPVAFLLRIL